MLMGTWMRAASRALTVVMLLHVTPIPLAAQPQPPMPIQDGQILPLWPGAAPGAQGTADADVPAITVFLPRTMTPGTPAMIVCPGGC